MSKALRAEQKSAVRHSAFSRQDRDAGPRLALAITKASHQISPASREIVYELFNASSDRQAAMHGLANATETSQLTIWQRLFPSNTPQSDSILEKQR